ncbi:hypothetical protein AAFC00_000361 [Neodothiora populina]|uniref:Very-long-chain (3R)-3-hydroxyacyl-CoA dehydratase n=1 Tax=Neodothiora populina TaxID=2781224 RepID=A0ABR3PCX0_9PEZI
MADSRDAQATRRPRSKESPSAAKKYYLIAYNFVSAILWSTVLGRVLMVGLIHGFSGSNVYLGVGEFAKWTQTLAALEVLHAAVGLVRAPLMTTVMQVASRFVLVWGIVDRFPNTTAFSPVYSSMLFAWSVTEVIRYSFFACMLWFGDVPDRLMWLRYNTFFVLYPLGISSECWLMYKAIAPAQSWNLAYGYAIKTISFIYIPGSYILYTHMMAQRRKVLKARKD